MAADTSSSSESLLYAKQVAAILKLQLSTIYALARNGTLQSIRVGNRMVRFRRSSIHQWLADRESGGHHDA